MQIGRLRTMGLAKEPSVGTLTTPPTEFLRFIPPDGFYPKIPPLFEKSIGGQVDVNLKESKGPASLDGMKLDMECEPENIGHILQAAFGLDTKTGPTNVAAYTHTFVRQAVAQLPTYTIWLDKNPLYPQFVGCMLSKLDFECKAKEMVHVNSEWTGLTYDATGITHAATYSPVRPFVFGDVVFKLGGSANVNFENIKVGLNNMVKADHTLNGSQYPAKIYSEGFDAQISGDLFFESATDFNNFLNNNSTSMELILTNQDNIPTSSPPTAYSLDILFPKVFYKTMAFPIPMGVLKISFTATAMFDTVAGYTMQAVLINGVSTQY